MIAAQTKAQLQNQQNMYVLSNSNLTSIRTSGPLNGLTGGVGWLGADIYRDMTVALPQAAIQGAFTVFGFSALAGTQAATTLQVQVSAATTIPQGYTVSTIGTPSSPAVLFTSTQSVVASAAGTVNVSVLAVNVGISGNVAAGSITNMISSVPNVVSITNSSSATGGTNAESLSAQLARFKKYLGSIPGAKAAALAYVASQVTGVDLAAAVSNPFLTGLLDNNGTFTDDSQELNMPKGVPFAPFVTSPTVDDAFYIGYAGLFSGMYIDVAVSGSGLTATWEYYNGTAWVALSPTADLTNNGQQSGTVAWTVPSDWAATTVDGATAYFIRLLLTSVTYTTMPKWYQAFANDPPPGYVFVYLSTNPAVQGVSQAVQTAVDGIRAAGDTVVILNAQPLVISPTISIVPTQAGAAQNLQGLVTSALQNLFSTLAIGQSLAISQIDFAITSLGGGAWIAQVNVSSPSGGIILATPSQLLTLGTPTITILPAVA